jgi:hypothetical protein
LWKFNSKKRDFGREFPVPAEVTANENAALMDQAAARRLILLSASSVSPLRPGDQAAVAQAKTSLPGNIRALPASKKAPSRDSSFRLDSGNAAAYLGVGARADARQSAALSRTAQAKVFAVWVLLPWRSASDCL